MKRWPRRREKGQKEKRQREEEKEKEEEDLWHSHKVSSGEVSNEVSSGSAMWIWLIQ